MTLSAVMARTQASLRLTVIDVHDHRIKLIISLFPELTGCRATNALHGGVRP